MADQAELDRLAALKSAREKFATGANVVSVTLPDGRSITYGRTSLAAIDREIMDLEIACGQRRRGALRMIG